MLVITQAAGAADSGSAGTADGTHSADPVLGILSQAQVRLADFGCALAGPAASREPAWSEADIRRRGVLLGTLPFRAPEILMGTSPAGLTSAADIWSLGCVLVWVLTGQNLFPTRTQVGLVFAILRQRGGHDRQELEQLPLWPKHPPGFSQPLPWPAPAPTKLGLVGETLLEQILALSPSARPSAADCLAHAALQAEWPVTAAVPTDRPAQSHLELLSCDEVTVWPGGQGAFRFRYGHVSGEVLQWLRSDAIFQDVAGFWEQRGFSWTGKGSSWYSEQGRKIQMAGKLGPCPGKSLNGMACDKPLPGARLRAFRQAWVDANALQLDRLQDLMRVAMKRLPGRGPNGDTLALPPREWLATQGTLQFHREGDQAWEEPWHWDGGASLLHVGFTLWGERELSCRTANNSEVRLEQIPGMLYMAPLTSFMHQVRHPPLQNSTPTLDIPGQGRCGVSVMMRTALFRHARARMSSRQPIPVEVFRVATSVVVQWLEECSLALPSLAACQMAWANPQG